MMLFLFLKPMLLLYIRTASNWSAARAASKEKRFFWDKMKSTPDTEPVYFQGEMVS